MTSDAKIGLLLGLLFIFLIAFIINGLPRFHGDKNSNDLTNNMVGLQNNPAGIGTKERKVSREILNPTPPSQEQSQRFQTHVKNQQDIRFKMQLPKGTSAQKEPEKTVETSRTPAPAVQGPTITEKSQAINIEPVRPIVPKVYTVCEGDTLTIIAKKVFGSEQGGNPVNIARIFQANRKLLDSPDEIYVGQKLTIPPLSASSPDKSEVNSVPSSSMLEKVESIGKRHLLTDVLKTKQSKQYIVREGDNLCKIAAGQLGNAGRYSEIAKLNADILDDEDTLFVGMRLKIPAQ
jgi:nucleoid-associated protein YgaU